MIFRCKCCKVETDEETAGKSHCECWCGGTVEEVLEDGVKEAVAAELAGTDDHSSGEYALVVRIPFGPELPAPVAVERGRA